MENCQNPSVPDRPPRRASARRGPTFSTAIAVVVTGALVALVVLLHPSDQMQSVRRAIGLSSERALPAPPIRVRGGVFAFTMTQQGSDEPVGWDPCQPIRYQVNPADAPAGGVELIERAIVRISAATGLTFPTMEPRRHGPSPPSSCRSAPTDRS